MFNTFQNSVEIRCLVKPDGPVLVRAQSVGLDPVAADMEFHRTRVHGRPTVFLAGSGLKGVLRAHCERLLRSAELFACDPTKVSDKDTCGNSANKFGVLGVYRPHAGVCPACFTFGSLKMAGRFRVDDAFPTEDLWEETNRTEVRVGVGIDRQSQAASGGVLYDTEVVVGGGFRMRIRGESFALWQLGLVLAAVDHLGAGLVRIGGCKSRGMGSVTVEELEVDLRFLDRKEGQLTGAREIETTNRYGLGGDDHLPAPAGGVEDSQGLFRLLHYGGDDATNLSEALHGEGSPLATYLAEKARLAANLRGGR